MSARSSYFAAATFFAKSPGSRCSSSRPKFSTSLKSSRNGCLYPRIPRGSL